MSKQFNPQYWTEQIKREIGLSHVSDEQLSEHYVDFGTFFTEGENKKTAKQYIEQQLEIIKEQYNSFDLYSKQSQNSQCFKQVDFEKVNQQLLGVASLLDDVDPDIPVPQNVSQLEYVPQQINRNSVKYFEVFVVDKTYIVAVNVDSQDFRVNDHINHIKNTSFFVEERNPMTFTGLENIISYYQFTNLIQPHLKPKNDFSFYEKVTSDVNTIFDGLKLEGF